MVCELALTGEDREYESRAPADWNPTGLAVERFDDALTAFQRHAMIERRLLDAGWARRLRVRESPCTSSGRLAGRVRCEPDHAGLDYRA